MWFEGRDIDRRNAKFFWLSLCHDTLEAIMISNFNLNFHYNFDIGAIDNMIPWERQIYLTLINREMENRIKERQKASSS